MAEDLRCDRICNLLLLLFIHASNLASVYTPMTYLHVHTRILTCDIVKNNDFKAVDDQTCVEIPTNSDVWTFKHFAMKRFEIQKGTYTCITPPPPLKDINAYLTKNDIHHKM